MQHIRLLCRHILQFTPHVLSVLWLCGLFGLAGGPHTSLSHAHAVELIVPEEAPVERFDFEQQGLEGWKPVEGQWVIEEMRGAQSGKRVLVQRAVDNTFNVIVAPSAPYTDIDVSVQFKPMAGRADASGGIVFRFTEGHYYVVRANALENNVRLYYYRPRAAPVSHGKRAAASAGPMAYVTGGGGG